MRKHKEEYIQVGNLTQQFQTWNFGNIKVQSIDISTMGKFEENGFYKQLCRVNLS